MQNEEVFNLINKQRTANGLSALKVDNEVQRVAKIKFKRLSICLLRLINS